MLILDRLLLLEEPLDVELLYLEDVDDWLRREFEPELEHDLERQEECLDLDELFDLVHVLDEGLEVQERVAIALRLVAHGSNIVYQYRVHVQQFPWRRLLLLLVLIRILVVLDYWWLGEFWIMLLDQVVQQRLFHISMQRFLDLLCMCLAS